MSQPTFNAKPSTWHIALLCLLAAFAVTLQCFIATRLSLWSDEIDTISPVFLPWRGDHSFWWQVQQYIATPPGESLVLRAFYRSGALSWVFDRSPELFWRIPYILVYAATAVTTYLLGLRWLKSSSLALICAVSMLCAGGPLSYATESRYYIWLAFFMTASVFLFLILLEEGSRLSDLLPLRQWSWRSGDRFPHRAGAARVAPAGQLTAQVGYYANDRAARAHRFEMP